MAFFFPDIYAATDWARGYEILDKNRARPPSKLRSVATLLTS
jgi:hypothetical protein